MTSLTDLQRSLLSTAAARGDGSLLPPAAGITTPIGRIRRTIATLVGRGLAADAPTVKQAVSYRADADALFGATVTDSGRAAIGAEPRSDEAKSPIPASKTAKVLALLRRSDGASLDEIIEATGWLPHSTRAALTGLRKKGHAIARSVETGASRYHLAA